MLTQKQHETVLLYNLKDKSYEKQLKLTLVRLGIRMRFIEATQYNEPIGYLAGVKGYESADLTYNGPNFNEEMLIMRGFTQSRLNILLTNLRKSGISIPLKAIITEHNITWNSLELHEELITEHKKFQELEQNQATDI